MCCFHCLPQPLGLRWRCQRHFNPALHALRQQIPERVDAFESSQQASDRRQHDHKLLVGRRLNRCVCVWGEVGGANGQWRGGAPAVVCVGENGLWAGGGERGVNLGIFLRTGCLYAYLLSPLLLQITASSTASTQCPQNPPSPAPACRATSTATPLSRAALRRTPRESPGACMNSSVSQTYSSHGPPA